MKLNQHICLSYSHLPIMQTWLASENMMESATYYLAYSKTLLANTVKNWWNTYYNIIYWHIIYTHPVHEHYIISSFLPLFQSEFLGQVPEDSHQWGSLCLLQLASTWLLWAVPALFPEKNINPDILQTQIGVINLIVQQSADTVL